VALLALFKLPEEPPFVIRFGSGTNGSGLSLTRGLYGQPLQESSLAEPVLRANKWTNFDVVLTASQVTWRHLGCGLPGRDAALMQP
jgi:hypothetical protein